MRSVISSKAAVIVVAAVLLLLLWHGFHAREACLLQGLDGNVWRINLDVQAEFRTPFSSFVSDPLQGMFDAYFPAFREYLAPYFLALTVGLTAISKSFLYFAYSALAMAAVFALARVLGIGAWSALLAGFLVPVTTMPLFSAPVLFPIMGLNPHIEQVLALSMLTIACFWALAGKSRYVAAILIAAAVACPVLVALGTVSLTALMVPAIAIYGGASLLEEKSWRARLPKLVGVAALILVPLSLGIVHYVYALTKYTAYAFFSDEFLQSRTSLYYASVAWQAGPWGAIVVVGGLLGAGLAIYLGPRRLRLFAVTHVAATTLYQALALAVVHWGHAYQGPSPVYFEIFFWPIGLLFLAYVACAPVAALFNWFGARPLGEALPLIAIGLMVFNTIRAHDNRCVISDSFEPHDDNAIMRRLNDSVRLAPGSAFRGYVATFAGDTPGTPSTWFTHHAADGQAWRSIGNDMRTAGLWQYRIPTLLQYNSFITPLYYRFASNLLGRTGDQQARSVLVLTNPREPILKLLGVSFLIADHDPGFGRVVAEVPVNGLKPLRLVQVADPNIGNYSPTHAIVAESAADMLNALAREGFDGRRDIVIDQPFDQPLVAVSRSELTVIKDGLAILADTSGRSVIVLPVQYSRCWELSPSSGARLLRANLAQLAIRFEGHLEGTLHLRFGPFWNSACRIDDLRDADRLGLGKTGDKNIHD